MSPLTSKASPPPPSTDVPIDLAIEVSPVSESHFFADLSGNVSHGGIFIATYRDIAVGTALLVTCQLPGEEVLLAGVVAWQRDAGPDSSPGVGVLWSELAPAAFAAVTRFCCGRAPLYYEVDLVAA